MKPRPIRSFRHETLTVEIYQDRQTLGQAAAAVAAERLQTLATAHATVPVVFATGASQLATLHALTSIDGLPWDKVVGFHMDEYIKLPEDHPASFRRYLRENLTRRVRMLQFHEINGNETDPAKTCETYAALLRSHRPQLCLLGIGENGHLAFNDPHEADFSDPVDAKIVTLDQACKTQQMSEGWFPTLKDVPDRAITLTIPALFRIPELILSIPGERKAKIVKRSLFDPISTACPATILRKHSNVILFLDKDSAAEL